MNFLATAAHYIPKLIQEAEFFKNKIWPLHLNSLTARTACKSQILNDRSSLIKHIKLVIFALLTLFCLQSCSDVGCVEADEFSNKVISIQSNPKSDKEANLYGHYLGNPSTAGQSTDWKDTGLISNGDPFIIKITGGWVAQNAEYFTKEKMLALPSCPMCSRNDTGTPSGNCYCQDQVEDQFLNNSTPSDKVVEGSPKKYFTPTAINKAGGTTSFSGICTDTNDSDQCSCKPMPSSAHLDDENFYHYSLNSYKKELKLISGGTTWELQNVTALPCAFRQGRYAMISLWGQAGISTPDRVYEMFTLEKNCPLSRKYLKDANKNEIKYTTTPTESIPDCISDDPKTDRWEYIFRSKDGKIFKKNDTTYHAAGEVVKVKLYDNFYNDNFGSYNITFLSGVSGLEDRGIIERIVSKIEDFVIGTVNPETNERDKNGIVEFMYKAITHDNNFIEAVQVALVLYICFFGVGYMLGVVELETKEILMRMIKLGLVLTFTTYNGWGMYKTFVVDFFIGGMNSLVSTINNLFNSYMGGDTSAIVAMNNANSGNGGRFAYPDSLIRDLTSSSAAKKIWGLFFMEGGSAFGLLYIVIIYLLVLYFVYVMVTVALVYIVNLIKLVFALALGPIFISFALFSKTEQMYKNWLSFLGARSLEMVILFLALYPFLIVLNNTFKEMLFYRACVKDWDVGPATSTVIISEIHRGLFSWFYYFIKIGSLTFLTSSMVSKSAELSGQLINIGGVPNRDPDTLESHGSSGFAMIAGSSGMMKQMAGAAKAAITSKYIAGVAAKSMRLGVSFATKVARSSGVGGYISKRLSKIPIIREIMKYPGIRTMARNSYIDKAINQATIEANAAGLKGAERDAAIREGALQSLNRVINNDKNAAMALGLDLQNIEKRFNEKLVVDPMKNFIKNRALELKQESNLIGKEFRQQLRNDAIEWARLNLAGDGAKVAEKYLKKGNPNSIRDYVRRKAEYRVSEAAEKFKDNQEMQKKFLAELQANATKQQRQQDGKGHGAIIRSLAYTERSIGWMRDKVVGLFKWRRQNLHLNPKQQQRRFLNNLRQQTEGDSSQIDKINRMPRQAMIEQLNERDANGIAFGVKINRTPSSSYEDIKNQGKAVYERRNLYSQIDKATNDGMRQDLEKIISAESKSNPTIQTRPSYFPATIGITKAQQEEIEKVKKAQLEVIEKAKKELNKQGNDALNDKSDERSLFEKVALLENSNYKKGSLTTEITKREALLGMIGARAQEIAQEIKNCDPQDLEKIAQLKSQLTELDKGLLATQMDDKVRDQFKDYLMKQDLQHIAMDSQTVAGDKKSIDSAQSDSDPEQKTKLRTDRFAKIHGFEREMGELNSDPEIHQIFTDLATKQSLASAVSPLVAAPASATPAPASATPAPASPPSDGAAAAKPPIDPAGGVWGGDN